MKNPIILAAIALCLLPLTAFAAPPSGAHQASQKKAAAMYQCQKCHMKYTAVVAKKDHYKDPMVGGKLVPVKPGGSHSRSMGKSMGGMKM